MKNVIIGTAGHIDHGKTTLIKALTGRDTDRLKEEKQRGISIDLGFTYFDLPSGRRAGIVDVPGHEKFIKNMLAGVMGIDIVVLVIAADEGVMPQTKEHLDILNLLGIKKGFVVVTKADLVDEDWMELVKEDIKEHLRDTFLEDSPMISVSSTNGIGLDQVIGTIDRLTEEMEERDLLETPRLPIDRVFTITGFGTIVTGTLISGEFKVGDEVQIYPSDKMSRIRSIQVHGKDASVAYAGQRVAINLAGLKKDEVERGNVVAPVDSMQDTMMIDVKLRLLKDSQRIIDNRTRLRLYIGSNEILCRAVFLDREQLTPGESCYAQLRLEEKVVAKRGDKFIIRFYSPMMTIGGGEVLEPNPHRRKRFDESVIEELAIKEKGEELDVVERIIRDKSREFPSVDELSTYTVMPKSRLEKMLEKLENDGVIITFILLKDIHVIHKDYDHMLRSYIIEGLNTFHRKNPLKAGMLKEELRSRYLSSIKSKLGESYINKLVADGVLKQTNEYVSLTEFSIEFSETQDEIRKFLEGTYLNGRFEPLKYEEVLEASEFNQNDVSQVLQALVNSGILLRLKDDIILHNRVYLEAMDITRKYIEKSGEITASELRDLLGSNRKYSIAILEELDKNKITRRLGDKRVLF